MTRYRGRQAAGQQERETGLQGAAWWCGDGTTVGRCGREGGREGGRCCTAPVLTSGSTLPLCACACACSMAHYNVVLVGLDELV